MKVHLSDILQGSGLAAIGRASALVDVNGLVYVLYVYEEISVAEHVHRALVVEKDLVWIKVSHVVIYVVRYLEKACAWRGLGVFVAFIVGLRVVLCFSVALA